MPACHLEGLPQEAPERRTLVSLRLVPAGWMVCQGGGGGCLPELGPPQSWTPDLGKPPNHLQPPAPGGSMWVVAPGLPTSPWGCQSHNRLSGNRTNRRGGLVSFFQGQGRFSLPCQSAAHSLQILQEGPLFHGASEGPVSAEGGNFSIGLYSISVRQILTKAMGVKREGRAAAAGLLEQSPQQPAPCVS